MCGGTRGCYQEIFVNGISKGVANNYDKVKITVNEGDKITSEGSNDPFNGWWTTRGTIQMITSSTRLSIRAGDFPDGMGFSAEYTE